MGSVQQAVLEFDEEIQAPWRPRLVAVDDAGHALAVPAPLAHPSRRSPSRVGACRPPAAPAGPTGAPARRAAAGSRPGGGAPWSVTQPRGSVATPVAVPGGRSPSRRPAPGRPAPVRLTRRARRLALVVAVAAGVALGSWLAPLLNGGGGELRLAGESSVVVRPGDTVWSIASSVAEGADVRAVVDEIERLNGLEGSQVVPGQILVLP